MRWGISCIFNGRWEEDQLLPYLHHINRKYREKFKGKYIAERMKLDGEETVSGEDWKFLSE